jgi:magnesium chelatase accessory protein
MVHGTGAATHSWNGLAPLLARRFTVLAPDLPGHGFSATPASNGLTLPGMARALHALLAALTIEPQLAVGHSAGAAILARMCLDGRITPRLLVSLNGALLPLRGLPGHVFSPMAKLLSLSSVVPRLFSWHATVNAGLIERMLRETGSVIDEAGAAHYRRLARCPRHVAGALGMMANWDLEPLARDLPGLGARLSLVTSAGDRTVPPAEARRVLALLPAARLLSLPRLGHLAHEEDPASIAALIESEARVAEILSGPA